MTVAAGPATLHALVVDDEPNIAALLKDALAAEGFDVAIAVDGMAALRRARAHAPDLVVLDIGLPGLDGFEVCKALRKESRAPIVVVSARGDEVDRIVGLELGADDYLVKPFSTRELIARVRAVMRRTGQAPPSPGQRYTAGAVSLDADRREVAIDGKPVKLKPREFDLLWLLVRNQGRVFTRDQIIETIWGFDYEGDPRTVDVHIRRLRRALGERASAPAHLQTVHGVGYKFSAPP
ncbi:MAG TPA: response regulator transcription factor [Candidatus Eremiobacteraceae bacterium]|nr:response regulator transcription factor [Candidatus Eremiobacteraceae bacterium]